MLSKILGNKVNNSSITKSKGSASNGAITVTLTAVAGQRRIIGAVQWSYSDVPTGGNLIITDGGTTILDIDITAAGPGGFTFCVPAGIESEVTVVLHAGGSGITGKLNVQSTLEPD